MKETTETVTMISETATIMTRTATVMTETVTVMTVTEPGDEEHHGRVQEQRRVPGHVVGCQPQAQEVALCTWCALVPESLQMPCVPTAVPYPRYLSPYGTRRMFYALRQTVTAKSPQVHQADTKMSHTIHSGTVLGHSGTVLGHRDITIHHPLGGRHGQLGAGEHGGSWRWCRRWGGAGGRGRSGTHPLPSPHPQPC